MFSRVLIKHVKKARQWCVTHFTEGKGKKKHTQKQYWFHEEAEALEKKRELEND